MKRVVVLSDVHGNLAALEAAGVTLGQEYPRPIVQHGVARTRALAALASVSKKGGSP